MSCVFCDIVSGAIPAETIWRGGGALAFLDNRPLFPGHVLLIPEQHVQTLADLPVQQIEPIFQAAQRIQLAVEAVMQAEGSFIAINNRVSQSVPHLHIHVVPRSKGDGLKGFFWPRRAYDDDQHLHRVAESLRKNLAV